MTRPLTVGMSAAMRQGRPFALLAEIDHPDGAARYWTGLGTMQWNGYSWTGVGILGSVSPVKHTSDIAIQEIAYILMGVDPDIVATLSDDVRNRQSFAWLACLDDAGNIVRDPYQLLDAQLDYQTLKIGDDGSATIQITARSGFYTLERGIDEAWTAERLKLDYPTDTGLDLVSALQNQDLLWTPS